MFLEYSEPSFKTEVRNERYQEDDHQKNGKKTGEGRKEDRVEEAFREKISVPKALINGQWRKL